MTNISKDFDFLDTDMAVMVGGGGKTTLINRLACEYSLIGKTVIITTTTKIFPPRGFDYELLLLADDVEDSQGRISDLWPKNRIVVVGSDLNQDGKIVGLNSQQVNNLKCLADIVLVEGDGAQGRPFKAPRPWEPVIPELASLIIPVVGVECIGSPLTDEKFHSVEQIGILTGLKVGDSVREKDIAKILLDPLGYKKNVPSGASWVPFINKVESSQDRKRALLLSCVLKTAGVEKVLIGSAGMLGEISVV